MAIAKTTCHCSRCGKDFTVRSERKSRADADRYEAWAQENITICPDCRDAERDAKARAQGQASGLPQLSDGSPKQIAWAERIRAELYAKEPELAAAPRAVLYQSTTSARWWIDHRLDTGSEAELISSLSDSDKDSDRALLDRLLAAAQQ